MKLAERRKKMLEFRDLASLMVLKITEFGPLENADQYRIDDAIGSIVEDFKKMRTILENEEVL
jgi:hypothetical protein